VESSVIGLWTCGERGCSRAANGADGHCYSPGAYL
jgi:hypothetical protein